VRRLLPGAVLVVLCVAVLVGAVAPALAWRLVPPRPLGVLILDKTVPDTTYRGHRAVVWVLNHLKLVHPGSFARYSAASDYAGFVPLTRRAWSVRPLPDVLGANRVVYVADTYGVTAGDLGAGVAEEPGRLLYGGLTVADIELLEAAGRGGATVIGEFNTAAAPTPDSVRARAARLFGVAWSGWTGRRSTDLMRDAPSWIRTAWQRQAGQPWLYRGPGVVLAHLDGRIVVLTAADLRGGGLEIIPTAAGDSLGMRGAPAPEGWFDLVEPAGATALATYRWQLTPRGDSALAANSVPRQAAAALAHKSGAARTYYLAGDFANVPHLPAWTELQWGPRLYRALPGWWIPAQDAFFWRGYVPLLTHILNWSSGA
jgi:hypothetical protein